MAGILEEQPPDWWGVELVEEGGKRWEIKTIFRD